MIATSYDLLKFRPDILTHGIESWNDQLLLAENLVIERVKTEWFVQAVQNTYIGAMRETVDYNALYPLFDVAYLNKPALITTIVYCALAYFIYPSITKDVDDGNDAFTRRAERYMAFYQDEWNRVSKLPLYDFNKDTSFSDLERANRTRQVRVIRA